MSSLSNTGITWTPEFSDLVIKCQETQFPVHKIIVCGKSKVLAAVVNGKFKVNYLLQNISALVAFVNNIGCQGEQDWSHRDY